MKYNIKEELNSETDGRLRNNLRKKYIEGIVFKLTNSLPIKDIHYRKALISVINDLSLEDIESIIESTPSQYWSKIESAIFEKIVNDELLPCIEPNERDFDLMTHLTKTSSKQTQEKMIKNIKYKTPSDIKPNSDSDNKNKSDLLKEFNNKIDSLLKEYLEEKKSDKKQAILKKRYILLKELSSDLRKIGVSSMEIQEIEGKTMQKFVKKTDSDGIERINWNDIAQERWRNEVKSMLLGHRGKLERDFKDVVKEVKQEFINRGYKIEGKMAIKEDIEVKQEKIQKANLELLESSEEYERFFNAFKVFLIESDPKSLSNFNISPFSRLNWDNDKFEITIKNSLYYFDNTFTISMKIPYLSKYDNEIKYNVGNERDYKVIIKEIVKKIDIMEKETFSKSRV